MTSAGATLLLGSAGVAAVLITGAVVWKRRSMAFDVFGDSHMVAMKTSLANLPISLFEANSGWNIGHYLSSGKFEASRSPKVLIELGSNDFWSATSKDVLEKQVDAAIAALPHAEKIVWIGPPHLTRLDIAAKVEAISDWLAEILPRKGAEFLDSREVPITPGSDGVHFSPENYATWARAISERVT